MILAKGIFEYMEHRYAELTRKVRILFYHDLRRKQAGFHSLGKFKGSG